MTKRVISLALEEILLESIKVLDHGFIRVIDYMGDDSAIVQAARVSYGAGTKHAQQDRALIRYLVKNSHTSPLEMCEIKFHVKMPIFVARQWVRHRTASINEYSARYSILSKEFYLPEKENLAQQSSANKQGREFASIDDEHAYSVLETLKHDASECYKHYIEMINEDQEGHIIDPTKIGIAREIGRMNLTLNHYTELYWKIDLHNLLHFILLRGSMHAQYEIRVYAEEMLRIVKLWVPYVYEAFLEYKRYGRTLSQTALSVVRRMISGEHVNMENSGLVKREWEELVSFLAEEQ